MRGLQCEKSLYLSRYRPELRDSPDATLTHVFRQGSDIGVLARQLFPGGVSAEEKPDAEDQVSYTHKLIHHGKNVIYEAAFSYDGVYCAVDILVRDGDSWRVFEVKSSMGVSETYETDAALQYYVLSGSGLKVVDFSIVHLNREYILRDALDVEGLFARVSVLETCRSQMADIETDVKRLRRVLQESVEPVIDIGEHCHVPYGCDYIGHCWKHIPEPSIFDLPRLRSRRLFKLYRSGVVRIEDIPDDFPVGRATVAVQAHKDRKPFVDRHAIRSFMDSLSDPLQFMDFETIFAAVPLFKGTRPYQQVPFQFCYGTVENSSDVRWIDFLAETGSDPRREFVEQLLRAAGTEGSVLVYNKVFEIARLRELADLFPERRQSIEQLIGRIRDLLDVFRGGFFYDPRMLGSNSIKAVLPIFAPDLDYGNLEIQDGGSASKAFEALQNERDHEVIAGVRHALKLYCRNDTEGMRRIQSGLLGITGGD